MLCIAHLTSATGAVLWGRKRSVKCKSMTNVCLTKPASTPLKAPSRASWCLQRGTACAAYLWRLRMIGQTVTFCGKVAHWAIATRAGEQKGKSIWPALLGVTPGWLSFPWEFWDYNWSKSILLTEAQLSALAVEVSSSEWEPSDDDIGEKDGYISLR